MSLRDVLDDRWRELDRNRPRAGLTTSPLPVETSQGPLLSAIDRDGGRHLLVPLAARQTMSPDHRSRAVRLVVRPLEDATSYRTFADLELTESSLREVFTSLCEDVLLAVGREPDRAVRGLRTVLESWRSLLGGAVRPLGNEALAGLFGELTVLESLAAADPGVAEAWRGPWGEAQDFHRGTDAIEVKATTRPDGRTVRIHGLDQLVEPTGGRLTLVWFRLVREGADAISVPSLVDRVLELVDDPGSVRRSLAELGYHEVDRAHYDGIGFRVVDTASHAVGPGFPRITRRGLHGDAVVAGLDDVVYTVDLDEEPARAKQCPGFLDRFGPGPR